MNVVLAFHFQVQASAGVPFSIISIFISSVEVISVFNQACLVVFVFAQVNYKNRRISFSICSPFTVASLL